MYKAPSCHHLPQHGLAAAVPPTAIRQPAARRRAIVLHASSNRELLRQDNYSADNPDMDDIVLDDAYYKEIGLTREQAMQQQLDIMYSVDPEAVPLDNLSKVDQRLPDNWRKAIEDLDVYGPQALVMAGFRAEEYAVARAMLDSLGAHQVKVLPTSQEMLQDRLELALAEPEIDWSAPRPPKWILGGAWGSQRTILFSGLSVKVQATLLELLESQGLPPVCVTMALEKNKDRRLGDVMAEAVKAQRTINASPPMAPWKVPKTAAANTNIASTGNTTSSSSSRSSSKAAPLLSGLPGKKGPLFSMPAAARGSQVPDQGLEPLQDLITPEMALARLKVRGAEDPNFIDLLEASTPADEGDNEEQQSEDAQAQSLYAWFTDKSTGETVELPWTEDEQDMKAQIAAAAAAAGMSATTGLAGTAAAATAVADAPAFISGDISSSNAAGGIAASPDVQQPSLATQHQQQLQTGGGADGSEATGSINNPADMQQAAVASQPDDNTSSSSTDDNPSLPSLDDLLAAVDASPSDSGIVNSSNGSSDSVRCSQLGAASGPDTADAEDLQQASVLTAIQAALQSGVDPEQLKQLIDAAATASRGASDPIDLLLKEDAQRAAGAAANAAQAATSSSNGKAGPNASVAGSSSSVQRMQPKQLKPTTTYGPAPPPCSIENNDALLKLRPDIARAFETKQIQFVDVNKLPKKYKQQKPLAALQERQRQQQQQLLRQQEQQLQVLQQQQLAEQQEQEQQGHGGKRWWQQQRRSRSQQQLIQGLSAGVAGAMPAGGGHGGNIVEVDVQNESQMLQSLEAQTQQQDAAAISAALQQQQQQIQGLVGGSVGADLEPLECEEADVNESFDSSNSFDGGYFDQEIEGTDNVILEDVNGEYLEMDESKLQQLVDSAEQQGLDVTAAVAQALAFGVQIAPEVAAAVGVMLPSAAEVSGARKDLAQSIWKMQGMQEGEDDDDVNNYDTNSDRYDNDYNDEDDSSAAEAFGAVRTSDSSSSSGGKAAAGGSSQERRVWGAGLSSAISRAKARIASRKQPQQGQQP